MLKANPNAKSSQTTRLQAVDQESGQDLDPSNRMQADQGPRGPQQEGAPEQGAILPGKVHTVKPFGLFVQLEGWRTNGLVHVRQVLPLLRCFSGSLQQAQLPGLLVTCLESHEPLPCPAICFCPC